MYKNVSIRMPFRGFPQAARRGARGLQIYLGNSENASASYFNRQCCDDSDSGSGDGSPAKRMRIERGDTGTPFLRIASLAKPKSLFGSSSQSSSTPMDYTLDSLSSPHPKSQASGRLSVCEEDGSPPRSPLNSLSLQRPLGSRNSGTCSAMQLLTQGFSPPPSPSGSEGEGSPPNGTRLLGRSSTITTLFGEDFDQSSSGVNPSDPRRPVSRPNKPKKGSISGCSVPQTRQCEIEGKSFQVKYHAEGSYFDVYKFPDGKRVVKYLKGDHEGKKLKIFRHKLGEYNLLKGAGFEVNRMSIYVDGTECADLGGVDLSAASFFIVEPFVGGVKKTGLDNLLKLLQPLSALAKTDASACIDILKKFPDFRAQNVLWFMDEPVVVDVREENVFPDRGLRCELASVLKTWKLIRDESSKSEVQDRLRKFFGNIFELLRKSKGIFKVELESLQNTYNSAIDGLEPDLEDMEIPVLVSSS